MRQALKPYRDMDRIRDVVIQYICTHTHKVSLSAWLFILELGNCVIEVLD
jgi:hypothetical protein